jgi:DNA-binding transcriptional MerR regulator
MTLKINPTEKIFYKISEVAEMFSVNISAVRFWEKEFNILKPKKNKKGNRLFTNKDIKNIQIIYHLLKERGFTVEGAKKQIERKQNGHNRQY